MKIKRILLTIAVLIGLPLFLAIVGFYAGNIVGLLFFEVDYAVIEAVIGFLCGGLLGFVIALFLIMFKIFPRNKGKKEKSQEAPPAT